LADALAHQEKLRKDQDFDPSFSQIMDLTQVIEFALEANDIRRIAQTTIFSRESRRAIIASSDLVYGFGRMFEILREIAGETEFAFFGTSTKLLTGFFPRARVPEQQNGTVGSGW